MHPYLKTEILDLDQEKDLTRFLQVPAGLYHAYPQWVPETPKGIQSWFRAAGKTAKTKIHPVLAVDGSIPIARGVAVRAEGAVDEKGRPQGRICYFEALPHYEVGARAVLQECEAVLKSQGVRSILAPKADNQLMGLLVQGFDLPHTILTSYNPPYYLEYFLENGYKIKHKTRCFYFTSEAVRLWDVKIPGYRTRTFDREFLEQETEVFNTLQNAIFEGRNGFIPRTRTEDRAMIQSLLPILDDELIIIAEDQGGRPVGLVICLPDVNQLRSEGIMDRARIVSIGAVPGKQRLGLGVMMAGHLARNLLRKGYKTAEASWILDDNKPPQNLVRRFNGQAGREFALLEKEI